MAAFSIHGTRNGKHITVTWTDGVLSGDADTVAWIEQLARELDGTIQGQIGALYTTHDHLASPYTARSIIRSVFPGTTTMTGKLPRLDENLPLGAII